MKTLPFFALALVAACLAACGPTVRTSQPTSADLSAYRTFAYLPNALVDTEGMDDPEVGQRVVDAVRAQMTELGYRVDRDDPELLVMLSTKRDTETEVVTEPVYANYPYTAGYGSVSPYYGDYYYNDFATYGGVVGYDTDTYQYKEGTLILNLVDRETRNTVWKAVAEKEVYDGRVSPADIAMMVDDMFAEFPVEQITAMR